MTVRLEWRPVEWRGGSPISTSLTLREAAELRRLAKGSRVLEVGSAYGFSTVVMAQVAESVLAVDPHQALGSLNTLVSNLKQYQIESKVEVLQDFSQAVLPLLEDNSFDLAFIDGDHHEFSATHDVEQAKRLVRSGGFVAVHDYDEIICPGVRPVCDRLLSGGKLVVDTLWVWQKPDGRVEMDHPLQGKIRVAPGRVIKTA